MPNESGVNQFGGFTPPVPYGAVKQREALKEGAPLAGSKQSQSDLAAPDRAHDRATARPEVGVVAAGAPGLPAQASAPLSPPPLPGWQEFALELQADPGVSDELRQLIAEQLGG